MMKKIISAIVISALLIMRSIAAEPAVTVDESGNIVVGGSFGEKGANKRATILVLSEDVDLDNVDVSKVINMGQVFTDSTGAYNYSFKMQGKSGTYYVRVGGIIQNETYYSDFTFTNLQETEELIGELNGFSMPSQVKDALSDPTNRAMLALPPLDNRTFDDLPDIMFSSLTNLSEPLTLENLPQLFRPVNALINIYDLEHTSGLAAILDEYHSDLGISLTEYKTLKNLSAVDLLLLGNPFNVQTFRTTFNNAVSAQKAKEESQTANNQYGGGSGGSSGGGGSSAGGSVNMILKNEPEIKQIDNPETPTQTQASFIDLENFQWAFDAINHLYGKGIIKGRSHETFAPEDNVTREEFVSMLVRAYEFEVMDTYCEFDDVSQDDWFYPFIALANSIGLTNGIEERLFGTGQNITREEMAVMAYRAALSKGTKMYASEIPFKDKAEVSEFAVEAVAAMTASEIINGVGDNFFDPKATATRAQAATIIFKLIN